MKQCFAVIASYHEDAYESDSLKKQTFTCRRKIFQLTEMFVSYVMADFNPEVLFSKRCQYHPTPKMETLPFILNVAFDFV